MKAYAVWVEGSDKGCGIVFAESRNQARIQAVHTDACEDEKYIDINARRLKKLDGLENEHPQDNYWLNEKIRTILVKEYGWRCLEPRYEDCETCCVRNDCERFK